MTGPVTKSGRLDTRAGVAATPVRSTVISTATGTAPCTTDGRGSSGAHDRCRVRGVGGRRPTVVDSAIPIDGQVPPGRRMVRDDHRAISPARRRRRQREASGSPHLLDDTRWGVPAMKTGIRGATVRVGQSTLSGRSPRRRLPGRRQGLGAYSVRRSVPESPSGRALDRGVTLTEPGRDASHRTGEVGTGRRCVIPRPMTVPAWIDFVASSVVAVPLTRYVRAISVAMA